MKSYVETSLGVFGRVTEARNLYVKYTKNMSSKVHQLVEESRHFEAKIGELLGGPVTGQRMLEVGPGQQMVQLAYFSRNNDAIGIDLDTVLPHVSVRGALMMARSNGWMRTAKTIIRKSLRIDSRFRGKLLSELQIPAMPSLQIRQMDATDMTFPDNHFDVVYSRSVFEHLSDPAGVLAEIRRVLKPGGVMYVRLHLYTSDSGSHDSRIYIDERDDLPYWAHLRPDHEKKVRSNTFLNKLRLADWERVFESELPGCCVRALEDSGNREREELRRLQDRGELRDYSVKELLSATVEVSWRKLVSETV